MAESPTWKREPSPAQPVTGTDREPRALIPHASGSEGQRATPLGEEGSPQAQPGQGRCDVDGHADGGLDGVSRERAQHRHPDVQSDSAFMRGAWCLCRDREGPRRGRQDRKLDPRRAPVKLELHGLDHRGGSGGARVAWRGADERALQNGRGGLIDEREAQRAPLRRERDVLVMRSQDGGA